MRKLSKLYIILMFVFLYFPIFYMAFYSFNVDDTMVKFSGFSTQWYEQLFGNTDLLIIVINTIIVALLSALISTIIGIFGALTIYGIKNKKVRTYIYALNTIMLVSPDVIIGISLLSLFTLLTIKLGFVSVVLAHIAFSVPVVVVMVLPRLEDMNKNLVNAAKDLGANEFQVFNKVIMPLISPGIIAGFFTAFTYSLDDFAVTFFVTGNGFTTLAVDIYSTARQGISMEINALSTIIFIITFTLALGFYIIDHKLSKKGAKK